MVALVAACSRPFRARPFICRFHVWGPWSDLVRLIEGSEFALTNCGYLRYIHFPLVDALKINTTFEGKFRILNEKGEVLSCVSEEKEGEVEGVHVYV